MILHLWQKYTDKRNLGDGEFIWAHDSMLQSIIAGKSRWQEAEVVASVI